MNEKEEKGGEKIYINVPTTVAAAAAAPTARDVWGHPLRALSSELPLAQSRWTGGEGGGGGATRLHVISYLFIPSIRAITTRDTHLIVEDGTAGDSRLEKNILPLALLIILVLQVSTTYRSERVRNAITKSCHCRAAKAVS